MAGVVLAAVAGIGFGLFQSVNRAALRGMDAYASTFLQLLVSAVILVVASLATGDPSRLAAAPASAWLAFAAAGLVHFSAGWTLLNLSQQRLGAARTSPLLASTPLFGVVIAALTLGEVPSPVELAGVALIVGGVYAVELDRARGLRRAGPAVAWSASLFGLGTALCWAVSPILIRRGLAGLPSPLLGVTIGLVAATVAFALEARRRRAGRGVDLDALVRRGAGPGGGRARPGAAVGPDRAGRGAAAGRPAGRADHRDRAGRLGPGGRRRPGRRRRVVRGRR
jgi:drug/metabolite transporter (DMT)-like permease